MKAAALFLVFAFGRGWMLAGHDLEWSLWAPIAFVWQDLLVALLFALFDWLIGKPKISWAAYAALVLCLAINVPLVRVLSTPMTPSLLRAASGPLADSIWHHVTAETVLSFSAIIAFGILIPWVSKRITRVNRPMLAFGVAASMILIALGPTASARVDTHGFERNVLLAYLSGLNPRVEGRVTGNNSWREPLVASGGNPELHTLRGAATGRNIVLIALESAGAQYLRPWGASEDPTPNLTALAEDALVFQNAYAVYPESIKGLFSTLCSQYPAFDTRAEDYEGLPVSSFPETLKARGYHTALFHSGRFAYLGMEEILRGRGFETMRDAGSISGNQESSFGIDERETVKQILSWIDQRSVRSKITSEFGGRPFFVTYLPIAGHHPYLHPGDGPFEGSSDIDRYRNALHYGDAAIGSLLEGLKQRGLYNHTCFIVYGDHGEAFGQHPGNYGHTLFIYEENVRVPLLFAAPGLIKGMHRVHTLASLIDIAPTACDFAGIRIPADFQGSSLLRGIDQMSLFYTDYSLGLLGLRDGPWKFIYELEIGRAKLYNLKADPAETKNMANTVPIVREAYMRRVREWAASERGRIERLKIF